MAISGIGLLGTDVLSGLLDGRLQAKVQSRERLAAGQTADDRAARSEVSGALGRLAAAAAALDLRDDGSALRARAVKSTDAAAVTGTADPSTAADGSAPTASYTVTVGQVAVAQTNVGSTLSSEQASGLAPGTYSVNVKGNDGAGTTVSFTVKAGDSNATVLGNLASAVNASTAGVAASVERDTTNGTSRLVLSARATGTGGAFTVADVTGVAVHATGIGTTTRAAADAAYTVNGTAFTSQTNDVAVAPDVHLTLHGASAAPVVLTVGPDADRIAAAAGALADAVNDARTTLDARRGRYPREAAALADAVEDRRGALGAAGVEVGNDGRVRVDATRVRAALADAPDRVRAALGAADGLAHTVRTVAARALGAPGGLGVPTPETLASYRQQTRYGALAALARGGLVSTLA